MGSPVKNRNDAAGTETDLASRWLGGSVLAASDESFGEKENLLTPSAAAFEPGRYGHRGEIVDGWETRRRREPGHDWALVRLGAPGLVTSVEIDTSFFTGNHPEHASVEACGCDGYPGPAELTDPAAGWVPIVPRSPLLGDARNTFAVSDPRRFTHLRLAIFPDGGVARLRAHGQVVPDPRDIDGLTVDLASQRYGGTVVASSDDFYTSARLLNRPDTARSMGEGWETRRRRDAGHDYAVIRLALAGHIRQLIVDTAHFKYNATAEIAVQVSAADPVPAAAESAAWTPLACRRPSPQRWLAGGRCPAAGLMACGTMRGSGVRAGSRPVRSLPSPRCWKALPGSRRASLVPAVPVTCHGASSQASWQDRAVSERHSHATADILAAVHGTITTAIGGLGEAELMLPTRCAGWVIGDLPYHLLLDAQRALRTFASPAAGPADVDDITYWRAYSRSGEQDVTGSAEAAAHARHVRIVAAAYPPGALAWEWGETSGAACRAARSCPHELVTTQGHVLRTADFIATLAVEAAVH